MSKYILICNKNFCFFFYSWEYNHFSMKNLLKQLIKADSTVQKGESAVAQIISQELGRSGIDCQIDTWDANRANITAQIKSHGDKGGLLFVCHTDVVGPGEAKWENEPFEGVEIDGRIYGRGSADMKGGTAAIVTAIREIVESGIELKGNIIFAATAGEETDSCGAKRFIKNYGGQLGQLCGVVIPEPTDFEVITAHRGMLWLQISTLGKTAHGSTPDLGINAISSMNAILNELSDFEIRYEPHKLLGNCSMSINTISGGEAINVVPDKCSIGIDIRLVPGQSREQIVSDFEKLLEKLKQANSQFKAEIKVVREVGALETDAESEFVKEFCSVVREDKAKAVGFTTDGPFLADLGAPVVIFGPGKPEVCHKPNEYIEIKDLEKAVEHYKKMILEFLS